MLRVGLVGLGDAGAHHARACAVLASEGALALNALCARDASKAAAFRDTLGLPKALPIFAGLPELLAADVCDAVVLATPDGAHAEQVVLAAGAGVAVLVEKPLALSRLDGERAIAAARAANVALEVGYHLRHHPAHEAMHKLLAERVGDLHSILVRWAWPDPAVDGWRARGEGARFWSLAALGTHGIDLALWLGGGELDAVSGLTVPARGIDRAAEVTLRVGDVLAHVSVSVAHRALSRVIVSGSAGELEAQGTLGARGTGELWQRAPRGAPEAVAFSAESPYVRQLRAFAARAKSGFREDAARLDNLVVLDHMEGLQ